MQHAQKSQKCDKKDKSSATKKREIHFRGRFAVDELVCFTAVPPHIFARLADKKVNFFVYFHAMILLPDNQTHLDPQTIQESQIILDMVPKPCRSHVFERAEIDERKKSEFLYIFMILRL